MSLFFDLYQQSLIGQAQTDAASAQGKAERATARIEDLERRTDRLALACQALWELLRANSGLTDEQVFAKMAEIDLKDGVADGRITGRLMNCTSCGRAIRSTRPKCLYCGHTSVTDSIVR